MKKGILFFSVLPVAFAFSAEKAATDSCNLLKNAHDVLQCALTQHPLIQHANIGVEESESLDTYARQRPNPQLSTATEWGPGTATGGYSLEVNLAHTFELGGKRDARIQRAAAQSEQLNSLYLSSKEQVCLDTLTALYRLRQIRRELRDLDEALTYFDKVEQQYRKRPRLTPEQTATLQVLEMAEADYKLKKLPLQAELNIHRNYLSVATGKPFQAESHLLPAPRTHWPELSSSKNEEEIKGAQVQNAQANLRHAQALSEIAQSEAWPNLQLGPSMMIQKQYAQDFYAYGINLGINLPIYHQNGGGKAYAVQEVSRSEVQLNQVRKELTYQHQMLLKKYQNAVKDLKTSVSQNELEQKQHNLEQLFIRGLISGPLIVETHRQLIDLSKSQNARELEAIDSLVKLLALEGNLFGDQNALLE